MTRVRKTDGFADPPMGSRLSGSRLPKQVQCETPPLGVSKRHWRKWRCKPSMGRCAASR